MVRADGRHFYPDFVIGVEGRKTEDGVLLADPKAMCEDWHPVVWDEAAQKAKLGPEPDWQKAPIW